MTSSPGKLKFKALKSLSLSSTVGEHYGEPPWVETLALCFRERRRRGLALRKLCIEGYGDGADVVCRLGSSIKDVRWKEVYEEEISEEEGDDDDEDEDDEDEYEVQPEDLMSDLDYY